MKRTDFIKMLEKNGWWLERDKGPHSVYTNGQASEPIPRHKELKEMQVKGHHQTQGAEIAPL